MRIVFSMAVVAALFVVYTLLAPKQNCTGNCAGCNKSCHTGGREP
jgi:hypothetical protein